MNRFTSTLAALGATTLALTAAGTASAQDSYMGSIFLTANTYCPRGTISAEGQILSIAQNSALYSLLGVQFGGNGQTTFALPDLRGREIIGAGNGPGLSPFQVGAVIGTETVTLTTLQMPAHTHTAYLLATTGAANTTTLIGNTFAAATGPTGYNKRYSSTAGANFASTSAVTLGVAGGSQPFAIRNPYLGMRYCVVTQGIYPSRP